MPACLALTLLPSFDLHPTPASWRRAFHFRWSSPEPVSEIRQWRTMVTRTAKWERIARALALHVDPDQSIVFGAVGSIGYRTELTILDPLGLVSPEVARREAPPLRASPGHGRRVEPTWFLDRRPDFLDSFVVPSGTPLHAGIRPAWRRADWFQRLSVERLQLAVEDGFAPGTELRLLRLDWST